MVGIPEPDTLRYKCTCKECSAELEFRYDETSKIHNSRRGGYMYRIRCKACNADLDVSRNIQAGVPF